MMPTPKELRERVAEERERKKKEEMVSLKEKIKILTQENENLKNSFFCPYCWKVISRISRK